MNLVFQKEIATKSSLLHTRIVIARSNVTKQPKGRATSTPWFASAPPRNDGPGNRARLLALAAAALFAASAAAAASPPDIQFTTLFVQPLISPTPVAGADGWTHLAYELNLVNETRLITRLDAIETLDADSGAVLARWPGDALAALLRLNSGDSGATLAAAHSGWAFLEVALPPGAAIPKTLRHRITTTRFQPAPGGDAHKSEPLDPKYGLPATITFEGVDTAVDSRAAVLIDPPLRGPGWVAFNGCCDTLTSHRGAVMAFNGRSLIAERFAIDFVQLDAEGRDFVGPADKVESYVGFDAPVYAVADGTVAEATDGAPEAIPGAPRTTTIESAAGNHVVLDLGEGRFALFAHLKPGGVAVKAGDRVKRGDVIGHLGSTGNSDGPHLHFHVMDGPSPLAASGLPYAFTSFIGAGRFDGDDSAVVDGKPLKIDAGWFPGPHVGQLPLNNEVVDFPEK